MLRRVVNLVTLVSLPLCIAVVALWVRGRHVSDTFSGAHWTVRSAFGGIAVAWVRGDIAVGYGPDSRGYQAQEPGDAVERLGAVFLRDGERTRWTAAGIYYEQVARLDARTRLVFVPSWMLTLLTGALPVVRGGMWAWRAGRRRARGGRCGGCGYDLTGNESGVCPECGRAAEAGEADAAVCGESAAASRGVSRNLTS